MSLIAVPKDATALDVLAKRYRAAFNKTQGGRAQWIDGTLELAVVVAEARIQLPSHPEFSRWLQRHQLGYLSPNDRMALVGFSEDLGTARKLLEASSSISWRVIWENRPRRAPIKNDKGTLRDKRKHISGHANRTRIPDVMRDETPMPMPPLRKGVVLKEMTREEVDPDFKGTALEFATKYGHVNLQTKHQIEHHKQQEALMAWIGRVADHDRTAKAILTAFADVDPDALAEWKSKPGKIEKLVAWCNSIELACESLRKTINLNTK